MPFSLLLSLHTGIVGGNWEIISDAANADGIIESMIKKSIYRKAALSHYDHFTILCEGNTFVRYKETQRS